MFQWAQIHKFTILKNDNLWWIRSPTMFLFSFCMQLMTNDKFVSAQHKVLANEECWRISAACFVRNEAQSRLYGPIDELLSDDESSKYRATTYSQRIRLTTPTMVWMELQCYPTLKLELKLLIKQLINQTCCHRHWCSRCCFVIVVCCSIC